MTQKTVFHMNGSNRIVWWVCGILAMLYIAIQGFIGMQVWANSNRLVRVETMLEQIAE